MMGINDERCSLCIKSKITSEHIEYYRVADYQDGNLIPAIIWDHSMPESDKALYPIELFYPLMKDDSDKKESDFLYIKWQPNPDDPNNPIITGYDDQIPLPYEVICPKITNEVGLRRVLKDGIEFSGEPLEKLYIVYEKQDNYWTAIQLDYSDLTHIDNVLRLKKYDNAPITNDSNDFSTVISSPTFVIDSNYILKIEHPEVGNRMMISDLPVEESEPILLRGLEELAGDYIRWYINKDKRNKKMPRKDRQDIRKTAIKIAHDAFANIDYLREYLESEPPASDLKLIRSEITRAAGLQKDIAESFVAEAVLADERCHDLCIEEVTKEYNFEINKLESNIDNLKTEQQQLEDNKNEVLEQISELNGQREQVKSEIKAADEELRVIRDIIVKALVDKDLALAELDESTSLHNESIGSTNPTPDPVSYESKVYIQDGQMINKLKQDDSLVNALEENLSAYGLISINSESDNRARLSQSIISALKSTNILVSEMPVAIAVANALSVAFCGMTARRIYLPPDCQDYNIFDEECTWEEDVVLIENILDPVNESLLFSILNNTIEKTIILGFTSYASLKLIASEAWNQMYLIGTEPLFFPPKLHPKMQNLKKAKTTYEDRNINKENLKDDIDNLANDLGLKGLPSSILALPAAIYSDISDNDNKKYSAMDCISQHLICSLGIHNTVYKDAIIQAVNSLSIDDQGVNSLLKKLASDE